ncbi:ATP-binding protein [Oceanisphaera avium]|uniref:histidine kinase n=1 Tax=Oceanisphaera avium TaxID=1903694 RepID=A0A1Y0CY95_9GAMM|nr:ATP-binding protein [Oceanisphaera avium]ART80290.1 two-component sensor histidine kinase [Oceanisphaera avium]
MVSKRWRFWLSGLSGQVIMLALSVLVVIQLVGIQIYRIEREETLGLVNSRFALQRVVSAIRLLNQSPANLEDEILRATRSETLRLRIRAQGTTPKLRNEHFEQLIRKVLEYPDPLAIQISAERRLANEQLYPNSKDERGQAKPIRRHPGMAPDVRLQGSIELADGRWLDFTSLRDNEMPGWSAKYIISFVLLAALLAALMIWLLQRATRPLKQLAQQAERLGRGDKAEAINETGPREIRDTLSAFNRMQERLDRFVSDRTRMLAAISHDLRTPLTTLKLRCEFLAEGEDKQKIQQSLAIMEQMLSATLQFAQQDGVAEPLSHLDLPSLLQSLCDDLEDNGHQVSLVSQQPVVYRGRAMALRRALQNLLDNGVKYGNRVTAELKVSDQQITINIRDFGPGIAPEQLEEVFKPFTRLDTARNVEDGSIGLGLAIARTLIHQHGGQLLLSNHPQGGLVAQIFLPR